MNLFGVSLLLIGWKELGKNNFILTAYKTHCKTLEFGKSRELILIPICDSIRELKPV